MSVKKIVIICGLSLLLCNSFADDVVTKCSFESGVTSCMASESGNQVLDVKCLPNESGQTMCHGNYTDKSVEKLQLKCDHSSSGNISCSGNVGKETNFAMNCVKSTGNNFKCSISDNSGESLTMLCSMGKNGMPVCAGLDNDNEPHRISCNGQVGKDASCLAN